MDAVDASAIQAKHSRNFWGWCRGCGSKHPCNARTYADDIINRETNQRPEYELGRDRLMAPRRL